MKKIARLRGIKILGVVEEILDFAIPFVSLGKRKLMKKSTSKQKAKIKRIVDDVESDD